MVKGMKKSVSRAKDCFPKRKNMEKTCWKEKNKKPKNTRKNLKT